jgi:hypothetical protein
MAPVGMVAAVSMNTTAKHRQHRRIVGGVDQRNPGQAEQAVMWPPA